MCELDLVFNFYKVSAVLLRRAFVAFVALVDHAIEPRSTFHDVTAFLRSLHKVYAILDEVFLAGEIEETSKNVVLNRLDYREYLES